MGQNRKGAVVSATTSLPTLEIFKGIRSSITSVGTSAVPLPASTLLYRKGIAIQNQGSGDLYIGTDIPEILIKKGKMFDSDLVADPFRVQWKLSTGGGTNEWYAVSLTDSDPGLTTTKFLYTATSGGGDETLRTEASVGSLSQHEWAFGDNDSLGFNTLYIATSGSTSSDTPFDDYESIINYIWTPDASSNYGWYLGQNDSVFVTADGSVRLFAYASATGNVATWEVR